MQVTQQKTIGGQNYGVTQLPAMKALRLFNRLCRIGGPALAKLLGAAPGGKLDVGSMDVGAAAGAVEALFLQLDPETTEALTKELLETATVDGKRLMPFFDEQFRGKLGDLFQLLAFALEVNFGDFFGGLMARVRARAPTASESPPPSKS